MKPILFAALLLTAMPPAHAQAQLYLSPGLQIGHGFGQGFFFSAQVSAGIIVEGIAPAVTIGIRQYKDQTMRYADVQLSLVFAGLGFGRVWVTPGDKSGEGSGTMTGPRFKLYGGLWALGSYDFDKLPGQPIKHHLGMFLVFPIFDYGTVIGFGYY